MDCCPTTYLVIPSAILEAHEGSAVDFPLSQAVGLIMYLTMVIQPDRPFNVKLVLRFSSNLGEVHVKSVRKILCYLRATTDIGLTFGRSGN